MTTNLREIKDNLREAEDAIEEVKRLINDGDNEEDEDENIDSTSISELFDRLQTIESNDCIHGNNLADAMLLQSFCDLCYRIKSSQKLADILNAIHK